MKNTNDIQQCLSGFKTVAVLGGPMVVRVHESLDAMYVGLKYRYFISVDFKFKQHQALNIGKAPGGCWGCTKTESIREANELQRRINSACDALRWAKEHMERENTSTTRFTVLRQEQALEKIVGRYNTEFVS